MILDRKSLVNKLNKISNHLDELPDHVIEHLSTGAPPPEPYDCEEVIKRMSTEIIYFRLRDKIYGG